MKSKHWKFCDKIWNYRGNVEKTPKKVGRRFCYEQEVQLAKFLGLPVRQVKVHWHNFVGEYTIYIDGKFFNYVDNLPWGGKYKNDYWRVTWYLKKYGVGY